MIGAPTRTAAALLTLLLLLLPDPASAQSVEGVELGLLGRFGFYHGDVGVENAAALGGRVGVAFRPSLSVELDWTYAEPDLSEQPGFAGRRFISHELFSVRLLFAPGLGERTRVLLGAGFSYDRYTRERVVGARGGGPGALAGLRFRLGERTSLRVEGTLYRVSRDLDAEIPRPSTVNLGLQAGLSFTVRDRTVERVVELPPPPPDTVIVVDDRPLPETTPRQICLPTGENVTVHVTRDGEIRLGDRRVSLRELGPAVAFTGEYAEGRGWFEKRDPVVLTPDEHGVPEPLAYRPVGEGTSLNCNDVARVGRLLDVSVFARLGMEPPYPAIFVPVRPGVWQEYRLDR